MFMCADQGRKLDILEPMASGFVLTCCTTRCGATICFGRQLPPCDHRFDFTPKSTWSMGTRIAPLKDDRHPLRDLPPPALSLLTICNALYSQRIRACNFGPRRSPPCQVPVMCNVVLVALATAMRRNSAVRVLRRSILLQPGRRHCFHFARAASVANFVVDRRSWRWRWRHRRGRWQCHGAPRLGPQHRAAFVGHTSAQDLQHKILDLFGGYRPPRRMEGARLPPDAVRAEQARGRQTRWCDRNCAPLPLPRKRQSWRWPHNRNLPRSPVAARPSRSCSGRRHWHECGSLSS